MDLQHISHELSTHYSVRKNKKDRFGENQNLNLGVLFFLILKITPRALGMRGKYSTTELHFHP